MRSERLSARAHRRLERSSVPLATMSLVGLPVAIIAAIVAHTVFHLALNVWLAMAICFVASAASTRAANAYRQRTSDVRRPNDE